MKEKTMRKLMISAMIAATILPAGAASAQSYREAQRSQREVREERRELRQAQRYGDRRDVREERRELRDARQEARQDWRDYRRSHRNVYRLPRYAAPRGYAYRSVRAGVTLAPAFYGRSYWIADPYRYRLPPTRGAQRWVRYGNDVVLINARNGRVLQVIPSFFW
jgi:Ni/Co efflux regulator RcnB